MLDFLIKMLHSKIVNIKLKILKDKENNLVVSFPYNPQFIKKIKVSKDSVEIKKENKERGL